MGFCKRLYWFPKINANSIVVRLIDFCELRLPRRLRLLAMTMFYCVSLPAKRSNLVITCENDYTGNLETPVGSILYVSVAEGVVGVGAWWHLRTLSRLLLGES